MAVIKQSDLQYKYRWSADKGDNLADLKLVFCTPNYPKQIDPNDHFCDDLSEDGEINDDQLFAAFELLNEMIRKSPPCPGHQVKRPSTCRSPSST
ncbi:hypothetical protein [Pseudomonas sp. GZD-222]|uniref:hypothetical protein n=1 Tax=Pseudomonas sp. GZD-222 TaxID=3404805 RepID=UPI003BB7E541